MRMGTQRVIPVSMPNYTQLYNGYMYCRYSNYSLEGRTWDAQQTCMWGRRGLRVSIESPRKKLTTSCDDYKYKAGSCKSYLGSKEKSVLSCAAMRALADDWSGKDGTTIFPHFFSWYLASLCMEALHPSTRDRTPLCTVIDAHGPAQMVTWLSHMYIS